MLLKTKLHLPWISLAGCLIYLAIMVHLNEVPVDAGDGLQHFSVAQYSWYKPELLLDHWAKPLFTLLSSPFAQGGYTCWLYFNLIIFLLTGIAGIRLLQRWKAHPLCQALFPLVLICIPDYTYCVLAGMTEVLFGFMAVLALLLASRQQWLLFALLISLMPFARSEGTLAILLGAVVLIMNGRFLHLPLLASGFGIYGLAGMLNDWPFLWYFTKDPYRDTGFYGSGPWNHYLLTWTIHFGKITAVILPVAIVGWWLFLKRESSRGFLPLLLFGISLYLGIVIAHSYFWAYGIKSSIGLTRLATLGIPPLIVLLLIGFNEATTRLNPLLYKIGMLGLAAAGILLVSRNHYPMEASPMATAVIEATDYVKANESRVGTVYYLHPLVYWRLGINPHAHNPKYDQHYFNLKSERKGFLKPGDVIIRDSQFGGGEQGLPLAEMKNIPRLYLARSFIASGSGISYLGEREAVLVYKMHNTDYLPGPLYVFQDVLLKKRSYTVNTNDLYVDLLKHLQIPAEGTINQLKMTLSWKTTSGKSPWMVLAEKEGSLYSDEVLQQNETITLTLNAQSGRSYKLYLYNPDQAEGTIRITDIRLTSVTEPGL